MKDFKLNWSIPEVLQAGAILATYHALCGLIFGQGIKEDIDIALNFDSSIKQAALEELSNSKSDIFQEEIEKTVSFLKCKHDDQDDDHEEDLDDDCDEDENLNSGSDLNFNS